MRRADLGRGYVFSGLGGIGLGNSFKGREIYTCREVIFNILDMIVNIWIWVFVNFSLLKSKVGVGRRRR